MAHEASDLRFASFVEGDDHVTQDETFTYNTSIMAISDDDNSDDDDEIEGSIQVDENFELLTRSRINGLAKSNNLYSKSFNRSNIASSTPTNQRLRTSQRNGNTSKKVQNNNDYELSDDE